jgi:hypothetical protein
MSFIINPIINHYPNNHNSGSELEPFFLEYMERKEYFAIIIPYYPYF